MSLQAYLPQDRLQALIHNVSLPDRTTGSALFADVAGFTALTDSLLKTLGSRRGAEELTRQLNALYSALIAEIEDYGGSVIGFAGDAMLCWFTGNASASSAVAAGLGMQRAMQFFSGLALKISIATGSARRFVVGDPSVQRLDVLAGAAVMRTAAGEHLANKGDVLIDEATAKTIGGQISIASWRMDHSSNEHFGMVSEYRGNVEKFVTEQDTVLDPIELKGWVHHSIYERETLRLPSFPAEFRPCVAMFIRFGDIDFDSEEARAQLDAFVRQAQHVAERYGGTLMDITIGDKGSYAYINFGAVATHEDDPRRAVRAALELKSLSSLSLQIGITRGMMWIGPYGGDTRRTFGALGDEVNVSARLMTAAAAGEVLISGHIHRAAATQFAFEARPALTVKGKPEPLSVFALIGERQQRAIRLQEPDYTLPMVGRENELRMVEEKLDLVLRGQSHVIGVIGEAGLGKSRLVAEIIHSAYQKGFLGYGSACQSDGIHTPYLVWKGIWDAFFSIDSELTVPEQIRLLEAEIEIRAPSRLQALPLLGTILGLKIPENEFTEALEPNVRQSALHTLLEDCLKTAAKDHPLLIVMEDLHWIDALSHDLLEDLAKGLWQHPVCFVLVYRPPQLERLQAPRLEALPQFTRLPLKELDPAEAEQVIRAKLAQLYSAPEGDIPSSLLEKLIARTQGNPFYLEELLNYLHDRGFDPHNPDALENVELPDSLHTLILSRIDHLTEHEKTTLRVASIIGRLFRAGWLTGYYPELGEPPHVKAALDEMAALDLTPLESTEPELAYLFKHIVTHEVTYENLPFATRARLHERLARYLETWDAAPVELLAFHYGRSENIDKKREYLRRAGEAAQKNFANDAALNYYSQLLPLLSNTAEILDVQMKRGVVLKLMGRWNEAEADHRAALDIAQQAQDMAITAQAQFALGNLCRSRGDNDLALTWLEQAKTIFTALHDPAQLASVLHETGEVLWHKGEYIKAIQPWQESLVHAREAGDKAGIAMALNSLGIKSVRHGEPAAGRALIEESLAMMRELGNKPGMASTLRSLDEVSVLQHDYALSRAYLEELLVLEREMGNKQGIADALVRIAAVASMQGNLAAAEELYEECLTLVRELGDKESIANVLGDLATIAMDRGDHVTAQERWEESMKLDREMDNNGGIAITMLNMGAAALSQDDYAKARVLLEDSLLTLREIDNKWAITVALINLAEVALRQNNIAEARALFEESLTMATKLGDKRGIAATQLSLAELAVKLGSMERAVMLAAVAVSLYDRIDYTLDRFEHKTLDEIMAATRAVLGEAAFQSAWEAGGKLSMDEAVRLAMDEL
jgi:class 3 adenylate cyclase/tetratricopeptide (TPR) repeat protein